jgi:CPA2 family monovalent cation:H+ antiporter-2
MKILSEARALRPDIPVLVRTRDDTYLDMLQEQGATEVVPETLEASLMLASHLLFLLDVPVSNIVRYVRNVRADRYKLLRGFFHGDEVLPLDNENANRQGLHAVTLQKGSKAIGKTLNQLNLEADHITVTAIRRGDQKSTAPRHDMKLVENDVLVLYGAPEDLEHAESMLI